MLPYVIYARKSTESEDRQVLSIEAQMKELNEYASKNNLTISKTYTEAKSAKRPGRPVFNSMIKELRRNKVMGILCWKLDRLTRNLLDAALISELLESGVISEIRTPSQTYRNNSNDKFMTGLDFIMAKKYIDDLSENTKRGLRMKAAQGWLPGRAPLGYLNHYDYKTGQRSIGIDPERFPMLRKMWDLMLTGNYSVSRILGIANKEWGFRTRGSRKTSRSPLVKSLLYKIFTDAFYKGHFLYGGELHSGRHKPMVTPEEFEQVQFILGRKGRPRRQRHTFAFAGHMRCGQCGAMVTAEEKFKIIKGTGVRKRYVYYHCTHRKDPSCRQGSIEESELKKQVDNYLTRLTIPKEYLDWILKHIDSVQASEKRKTIVQSENARMTIRKIQKRLNNLLQLKISPENTGGQMLSDQEFLEQKNLLLEEKLQLETSLNKQERLEQKVNRLTKETFEFATYARIWFAKGDPQRQRTILACIGSNHRLVDKKLLITAQEPLAIVERLAWRALCRNQRFEPGKLRYVNTQTALKSDGLCADLGELDDVRTRIRKILQNPHGYHEEMDFFTSLRQLQSSMAIKAV